MFRERIILRTKYGTGAQTAELLKKVNDLWVKHGTKARILRGVSGQQGTFVFERDFDSYDKFFAAHQKLTTSPEFRQWFPDFSATMDYGVQEYYEIVA